MTRKNPSTSRMLAAELLGTSILLATVVGSGIMAEQLSGGNVAIALLGNTLPTGAILIVLITILGPVSGAHFNPIVSLAMALRGSLSLRLVIPFVVVQTVGTIIGVWLAHAMFDLTIIQTSAKLRWGTGQWISEAVATAGLLLTIFGGFKHKANVALLVGLHITAAYWFTASTSFANPAVTLARALTNTFAGIAPSCVLPFVLAQLVGLAVALPLSGWLFGAEQA